MTAAAVVLPLGGGVALASDGVGEAVAVSDMAQVSGDAGQRTLAAGSEVYVGDLVVTDSAGEAQIRFTDNTRMVVGNNSSLVIDEMLFRGKAAENRFAVRALGGAFRFISGDSGDKGFSIRTPSATIGVRGTAFDFVVIPPVGDNPGSTKLLLLEGEATMCSEENKDDCETVATPCGLLQTDDEDEVEEVAEGEDRDELLREHFPHAASEEDLHEDFRVGGVPCLPGGLASQALDSTLPLAALGATSAAIIAAILIGTGGGGDSTDKTTSANGTNQ